MACRAEARGCRPAFARRAPARQPSLTSRAKAGTFASDHCSKLSHVQGRKCQMTISTVMITPLVALIAGILILIVPRLLNVVVAIYLIFIGVTGLWPNLLHNLNLGTQ